MTGPDHVRAAEFDLECADQTVTPELMAYYVGIAQVHATLALVAATVRAGSALSAVRTGWSAVFAPAVKP